MTGQVCCRCTAHYSRTDRTAHLLWKLHKMFVKRKELKNFFFCFRKIYHKKVLQEISCSVNMPRDAEVRL